MKSQFVFYVYVRNDKARKYLTSMRKKQPVSLAQKLPNADPFAVKLLERLLAFDPKDRPTAEDGEYDIISRKGNCVRISLKGPFGRGQMQKPFEESTFAPNRLIMPARFKVKKVQLHGDELATVEVLDPDFGEAAIGRAAPVDTVVVRKLQMVVMLSEVVVQ
ncbi:hypothetical protein C5167_040374 [Papaver somniferum]|uniref:Protein kinase domain-containing protein n=1 Tax=Papaver somniferum TaxID=3469 RepID=A0A4Y7II97_PAPSO|nr:hypothetical protein C5167_040374 [Papaver somniferum]